MQADIVIVGAGIMGLLAAYRLNQAGYSTIVIDKQAAGREASWAGGGIISPLYPWRYPELVAKLTKNSHLAYQQLQQALLSTTGIDIKWQQSGLLIINALDYFPALNWAKQQNVAMSKLDAQAVSALAPKLHCQIDHGLWLANAGQVRPPRLGQALKQALRQHPLATLVEHEAIIKIKTHNNRITAVASSHQEFHGKQFVIAAGCWSANLLKLLGITLDIQPVRGQMLLCQSDQQSIEQIILHRNQYVIPRDDGLLLIGSTLEHVGFDKAITQQAKTQLWQQACDTLALKQDYRIIKQWAGLRPSSPEGIPFIGQVKPYDNLFINAGHYRNGLVTAPRSIDYLMQLMTTQNATNCYQQYLEKHCTAVDKLVNYCE